MHETTEWNCAVCTGQQRAEINHDGNKNTNSLRAPGYPLSIRAARFFVWFAVSIVLLVVVGFSRTYYLHTFLNAPKLTISLHVHAAVMTGWIVLFAVQAFLIVA